MTYDEYIHSRRPVHFSIVLFAVALLLPISIIVFEGWHSGVPYGFGVAVAIGVLIPGIYLFRPLALGIWLAFSGITSLVGLLTFRHYWRSVPDWMDAQIPHGVTTAISFSLYIVQTTMLVLGICGWVRYIRIRNANHTNDA
jgi:hypothetical protein